MSDKSQGNKINNSVLLQEPLKEKVDIQIDEYEVNENAKELAILSINKQVKTKPHSNFLQVSSKNRLTTSLNTSTSSSLSSSSSSSSSANNINIQQQQQGQISQIDIIQSHNTTNILLNHPNNELLEPNSEIILTSPHSKPTFNVQLSSHSSSNQTNLTPTISINSRQSSQSSSSLLTLSNITNTSSNSMNNLANSNQLTNLNKNMSSNSKNNSTTISRLNSNTSNITSPNNSNSSIIAINFNSNETPIGHGHFFTKKTFHKPTFCHHCTEMLWGLIGQGFICEGNFTLNEF